MAGVRVIRRVGLGLGLGLGLVAVAYGDATPMVRAPAGWHADAERAAEVAQSAGKHDGVSATEAWDAPPAADTGVALFVTRTTTAGAKVDAAVKDFGGGPTTVDARGRTVGELDKHDDAVKVAPPRAARRAGDRRLAWSAPSASATGATTRSRRSAPIACTRSTRSSSASRCSRRTSRRRPRCRSARRRR